MSADLTAELLLRFYGDPTRYRGEACGRDAPPVDNEVILKLALGRPVEFIDPALNRAGTVATLNKAAALYVRQVFFRPDATPYQTLGLAPGASAQAIKESFRLLMQLVHPDRQDAHHVWPDSFAAQANRAHDILRDEGSRAAYDRDVEARARAERATAAAKASRLAAVVRPAPRPGRRKPLDPPVLPEWLTAGVGGFARAHPAAAAFSLLVVVVALVIGVAMREGPEVQLTRDTREVLASATPAIPAMAPAAPAAPPAPTPAARVAQPEPAATARATSDAERTDRPKAPASRAEEAPKVPESARASPRSETADAAKAPPANSVPLRTGLSAAMVPVANAEPVVAPSPPVAASSPQVAAPSPRVAAPSPTVAAPSPPVAAPPPAPAVTSIADAQVARALVPASRTESPTPAPLQVAPAPVQVALASPAVTPSLPPATVEIETLFADFVDAYERGRTDAFAALFDDNADTNLRHGRAAIRGEYDELFRLSRWRRMQLTLVNWRRVGDRAFAKGEIAVQIGWYDGREIEQRVAVDMELVRRGGRAVIARLSHQPKNP